MIADCTMTTVLWYASMVSSVMLWGAMMDFSTLMAIVLWNATKVFCGVTTMWWQASMTVILWNATTVFSRVTVALWDTTIVFLAIIVVQWNSITVFSIDLSTISWHWHTTNILSTTTCNRLRIMRLSTWWHLACVHWRYVCTTHTNTQLLLQCSCQWHRREQGSHSHFLKIPELFLDFS